jgi:hypothetical protein
MALIVTAALSNRLKPSIGRIELPPLNRASTFPAAAMLAIIQHLATLHHSRRNEFAVWAS